MKKKRIYLIPGQGSDYRIYKYFNIKNSEMIHIQYIVPEESESMKAYAMRLSEQIDTSEPFSLIGVSLGGMLATEISEFLNPTKTIIISSAKNRNELPFRYRFQKKIPVNRVFSGELLRFFAPLAQLIVEPDSRNERTTCKAMLKEKNALFMKRSVDMIVNWERETNKTSIIHIHGDNDHTIPVRNVKNITYKVVGGSHMMAITRGEELNRIVNNIFRNDS